MGRYVSQRAKLAGRVRAALDQAKVVCASFLKQLGEEGQQDTVMSMKTLSVKVKSK